MLEVRLSLNQEQSVMSENSNNNNKKRKNNYNRNRNKNRNNKHNNQNAGGKPKRYGNRNRRPKSLTPNRILQKYENLMEQHAIARKKYFEMHGRIAGKQLQKVENNFTKTLVAIKDFVEGLKDWQKEILDKKLNFYPEDRQFSTTHELEPVGDKVDFDGEFEDPHLLETQKNHQWSNDTEESSGSMEDYNKYKGIVEVQ